MSGEITREGMLGVIQEIERRRTTGVLVFEGGDTRGEIELIAGQIALDQEELSDGRDPVEALLELRSGTYQLFQRLPSLPVSKGDDMSRTGSLLVHVPADLMNYCEHAGMTGTLSLENEGRRAEIVYDSGELVAIRVEGDDEQDLHDVFGWEEGTFHIQAHSQRPKLGPVDEAEGTAEPEADAAAAPSTGAHGEETGAQFLKSVEVALTHIVEQREKRRSPTRTSPPMPPRPKARPPTLPGTQPAAEPPTKPAKRRREPTVQVIYLSARSGLASSAHPVTRALEDAEARSQAGTRHLRKDITAEVVLPEASPERRRADEVQERQPRRDSVEAPPPEAPKHSLAGTLAWVVVVLVLLVLALGLLASLPPIG